MPVTGLVGPRAHPRRRRRACARPARQGSPETALHARIVARRGPRPGRTRRWSGRGTGNRSRSRGRAPRRPRPGPDARSRRAGCPSRPRRNRHRPRGPARRWRPSPAGKRARPIRTSTRSSSSTRTRTGPPAVRTRPSAGSRPASRRCSATMRMPLPQFFACEPVGVPDRHTGRAVVLGGRLQDAVTAHAEGGVEDAAGPRGGDRQLPRVALDDEVVIARPCHFAKGRLIPLRLPDRPRGLATGPAGAAARPRPARRRPRAPPGPGSCAAR